MNTCGWQPFVRAAFLSVLALCFNPACSSPTLELRAKILDDQGKPIRDAIFYAEAWAHSKCFDFVFVKAGEDGQIPPAGAPPLKIRWRAGAKLALAAFGPGKKPAAVYDELGRVRADGITFRLVELGTAQRKWEPRLAQLDFPFTEHSGLRQRVARPEAAELCRAFRAAYTALGAEPAILPNEQAKREALDRLVSATGTGP